VERSAPSSCRVTHDCTSCGIFTRVTQETLRR